MLIHVVPSITEEASGPSYSVTRLCSALDAQGQDVKLAVLELGRSSEEPLFLHKFRNEGIPRRLGRSIQMLRWLQECAFSGDVKVIHNHSLWMMPNVYPGWVARRFDIPLVMSPRGTLAERAFLSGSPLKPVFWHLFQKSVLSKATCFHATAISEYEDIRRLGFRQPVAVIPNGVDVPESGEKTSGGRRTLLFLGRINEIKGLDMLLPAWKSLQAQYPEWDLKIAGPDHMGYSDRMKKLAGQLGLKRVDFSGPVYGAAKWRQYLEADLFVLPTYSENFGMSVAESLAAGTPAVVTKGAPWEGLQTFRAGHWIDFGVDPLVASLERLMAFTPEDLAAMGERGREWMLNDFSWERIGRQMQDTYSWLQEGQKVEVKPEWIFLD